MSAIGRIGAVGRLGLVAAAVRSLFNPLSLFSNGEQGVWYDPSDLSTLFQDSIGNTPLTAVGQPVGLMLDKRLGLGSEIVESGEFDSDTGWAVQTGWNISGGVATKTDSINSSLRQVTFNYVPGNLYEATIDATGENVRCLINQASFATIPAHTATGVRVFRFRASAVVSPNQGLSFRADAGTVIRSVSIREILGNHAIQTTENARPLYQNAPKRVVYDGIDDSHTTNFSVSLGSNCTVARAIPGFGAQILTSQTIGTSFTHNVTHAGMIVVNRALTSTETQRLTAFLNARAFA